MFNSKKNLIACLLLTMLTQVTWSSKDKCDHDLLKIFAIQGTLIEAPRDSGPTEKAYCRRNHKTCCTAQNYESINLFFVRNVSQFKKKMEIVEEVLSLFKGKKFAELIETIKEKDECSSIVKDMNIEISGTKYDFFSTIYQNIKLDSVANILLDVETYIKKVIWFHADVICSVCNPVLQDFYNFKDGGSELNVHLSACFEIMEEKEFELNLINLYENFISKVVEFVKCGTEEEQDNAGGSEVDKLKDDATNSTKLLALDSDVITKLRDTHHKCIADKNLELPECQKFCSKDIRVYSFPVPNFFRNMQVSLKILFEALAEFPVEEYYEGIKEEEWQLGVFDEPVTFFEHNSLVDSHKLTNLQWVYSASDGNNMYREIMSKKFTNAVYESARSLVVFTVAFLGVLSLL